METTYFKTPTVIEVGSYIAPKSHQVDGRHCAMCGKPLGSAALSVYVEITHCEPQKGDEVEVTRGEHLHAWHILINGGGAMGCYIGPECIKKITWRKQTLTNEERQEVEDYG